MQLAELQEEVHKKDSRWSAAQVRTRDRLKQLEQENAQLKNEVEKLKKEKLHTKLVRFAIVVVIVVVEKEHMIQLWSLLTCRSIVSCHYFKMGLRY